MMNDFNNIFSFYTLDKLRELVEIDLNKKFEDKKTRLNKNKK